MLSAVLYEQLRGQLSIDRFVDQVRKRYCYQQRTPAIQAVDSYRQHAV